MLPRSVLLLLPIVGALVCGSASAQDEPAPAAESTTSKVERAIADCERFRDDPKEAARRRRALAWLGEMSDPAATDYLKKELESAGTGSGAVMVLDAIAKAPRPTLHRELLDALHGPKASEAVRVAAAKAIAAFGERGIDRLLEIAHGNPEATTAKARETVIGVLIDSGDDRALRTFAPKLLEGPMADRLQLLRRMENVGAIYPIDAARIRLVTEGTLDVAAVAWRQLAMHGHDRARSLAIDMLERLVDEPRPGVAADLIGGVASVGDPDLYPVLLRFAVAGGDVVRKALRSAAPAVAKDPALVEFLIQEGIENDDPRVRDAARLLLKDAPARAFAALTERIRADLRRGGKKSLDLAVSLHDLLAKDPGWAVELLALANSRDDELRTIGLSLLLQIGSDVAIPAAQKCLSHRSWPLRSLAYRYLTKCRDTSSIPLLIARFEREEEGRLASELADALFVHTGTRCWRRSEWDAWWEAHKVGFALPHADTVRSGDGTGGGSTVSYHGIPVTSRRAAFLIDFSGSMAERIGTDKKRKRIDEAKEQLAAVVQGISSDHRMNLIWFSNEVHEEWDRLQRATEENKKKLLDDVAKLGLGPGTNVFDAIELAFRDPDVDTIYLLTDGEPTAGRFVDTPGILEEVRRMNRGRQIVLHAIGIGTDSELLRRLAEDSGGVYKRIR